MKTMIDYFRAHLRYFLYTSNFWGFLLPEHIEEQIYYRTESMDNKCYKEGQCKMCGCTTIALQCANKACDKPCYPKMLSKKEWDQAVKLKSFIEEGTNKKWYLSSYKFYPYKPKE